VSIADDGVGLQTELGATPTGGDSAAEGSSPDGSNPRLPVVPPGTRSGLLTHGALLALVGGSLAVRSRPSAGTTVTLRVPRARANSPSGEGTSVAAASAGAPPTGGSAG